MIAPERWYEYEKKYQRYGFDMNPSAGKEQDADLKEKLLFLSATAGRSRFPWYWQ